MFKKILDPAEVASCIDGSSVKVSFSNDNESSLSSINAEQPTLLERLELLEEKFKQ